MKRERREAELHDEALFKQPPPAEDCPICMLPLPSLYTDREYRSAAGKIFAVDASMQLKTRWWCRSLPILQNSSAYFRGDDKTIQQTDGGR